MQFINYIKTKLPFFVALSFTFVLASCGSYQYVGYDSDGIYGEREVVYEEPSSVTETQTTTNSNDNSYYKNYFNEKAMQYAEVPSDERVIFTDIDSYQSEYSDQYQEENSQTGYPGWGQANSNVTINYIDNGWGWNNWGWNNWGWNNWGWNAGFGWGGWNNWGWNTGFGWAGWNAGFGWGGWNNWAWGPAWNGGWGWNTYNWNPLRYNLAFQGGRRGSNLLYSNRNSVFRRNAYSASRNNSSNVTRRNLPVTRRNSAVNRNNSVRSSIRRNTSTRTGNNRSVRPRTNSRSNSSVIRSRPSSSRSSTRMSTPRSSRSSSVRSSGRSSRSSGSRSSSSRGGSGRRR